MSSKNKKTGIGIIGTGVGLRTHYPAFCQLPEAEVVAISGSDDERSREFATKYDIALGVKPEELCELDQVDLVCVTSPNVFHFDHVLAALNSGKHVLCEKPLAVSQSQNLELIRALERFPNQIALVNHQLRFNPYLKTVKSILEEGSVGRPYLVRLHQQSTGFSNRDADWNWSFDAEVGGGVRLAMGSHLIDLVSYWFSSPIVRVCASMDPVVMRRKNSVGRTVDVNASSFFGSSLELESGVNVHMSVTAAACSKPGFEFSIYGDKGELHFNLPEKLSGAFLGGNGSSLIPSRFFVSDEERENRVSIFSGSFPYFATELVTAIRLEKFEGIQAAATFQDALATQIVLDEMKLSANLGTSRSLSDQREANNYV